MLTDNSPEHGPAHSGSKVVRAPRGQISTENWKEQFAFVSGSVVVAGVALLKLWPYVATFQTGRSSHVFSVEPRGQTPSPEYGIFLMLSLMLALGTASVAFSAAHIICRGLWLAMFPYRIGASEEAQNWLRRRANQCYLAILCGWALIAIFLVNFTLIMLSTPLELWLRTRFSSGWASFISSMLPIFLLIGALLFLIYQRLGQSRPSPILKFFLGLLDETALSRTALPAVFIVLVLWVVVMETCYTVDLSVDRKVLSRSKQDYAEIGIRLGGATSYVGGASAELRDENGKVVQRLDLRVSDEGLYTAYVGAQELPERFYKVILTYPRYEFSNSYPFFQQHIERSKSLVVVP